MASFNFPMWKVISSLVYILFRIKHSTNSIQLMLFNLKLNHPTAKDGGGSINKKDTHIVVQFSNELAGSIPKSLYPRKDLIPKNYFLKNFSI